MNEYAIVEFLLDKKATNPNKDGYMSPLCLAAEGEDPRMVEILLKCGANIEETSEVHSFCSTN